MKRLLSAILSVSLVAALSLQTAFAVPSSVTIFETAEETITENIYIAESTDSRVQGTTLGPVATIINETTQETNTVFGTPDIGDTQFLGLLEGEGTQESPYLISNALELQLFASNVNMGIDSDKYYKLTSDIDLEGAEWVPVGFFTNSTSEEVAYSTTFRGVFDGDGHTVSNFKITSPTTAYVGFFGYVYNCQIKNFNIDSCTVDFFSDDYKTLYAAILAGRVIARLENSETIIENCSITNSSLNVSTGNEVFAGSIAGSAVAGRTPGTRIEMSLINSDSNITVVSSPKSPPNQSRYHLAGVGGIAGIYSAEYEAEVVLRNSSYSGNISADTAQTSYASPYVGGIFGILKTKDLVYYLKDKNGNYVKDEVGNPVVDYALGGTSYINSCSSEGSVIGKSIYETLCGGFAGYIDATVGTYINDCYSSVDVSAISTQVYVCIGGFTGLIEFAGYSTLYPKTFINCYASGDVIDLKAQTGSTLPNGSSYVGYIFGYSHADIFDNTYKLESQTIMGKDIPEDLFPLLSEEDAIKKSSYDGFDFEEIWEINPSVSYPYPTLREKIAFASFINEGEFFGNFAISASGIVKPPIEIPKKAPSTEQVYSFSHWSTTPDGEAFDFENTRVFEKTDFYAVYTLAARTYKLNFLVDGEKFVPESIWDYGAPLAPTALVPTKEETTKFSYIFSHWSLVPNGDRFDFTGLVADADYSFHAVFTEIDKTAWGGDIASQFTGGNGTATLPYQISSSEEFALFAHLVNQGNPHYSTAYYILENDINLGNNFWVPIGTANAPFSGNFNGNGYTIRNYKVQATQYAGLFGYIFNGSVENVTLSNFDINFSLTSEDNVYIGGVAGYVLADDYSNSIVSNVCVCANDYNILVSTPKNAYVGGFVGYGKSDTSSNVHIINSYTRTPIIAKNNDGYLYLGGIAGSLYAGPESQSLVKFCYNTGDLSGYAVNNSSRVGGLVADIFSSGDKWGGDIGGYTEETSSSLLFDDVVYMISNSFSIANLSSYSEKYSSYVGRIVASISQFAACDEDTTRYLSKSESTGIITISPNNEFIAGAGTTLKNLKSKEYLIEDLGFDFENVWLEDDSGYPVLRVFSSDKPVFQFTNIHFEDSTLTTSVNFLSKDSQVSTLVFTVLNQRNQVIRLERVNVENGSTLKQIKRVFENLPLASKITVSAIDSETLIPLFASLESEI